MGRQLDSSSLLRFLKTGITLACFNTCENSPVLKIKIIIAHSGSQTMSATSFKWRIEVPSNPGLVLQIVDSTALGATGKR